MNREEIMAQDLFRDSTWITPQNAKQENKRNRETEIVEECPAGTKAWGLYFFVQACGWMTEGYGRSPGISHEDITGHTPSQSTHPSLNINWRLLYSGETRLHRR